MPYNEKQAQSAYKYKKAHIKRVPLDMQITDYEKMKTAAEIIGESVNTFIKKSVAMRMETLGE